MAGEKTEEKAAAGAGSSGERNLFGALCYIISIIVPLFILFTEKKKDRFLAFHAWQSLLVSVAMIVVFVGFGVIVAVASIVTMGIGGLLSCLYFPLILVWAVAVLLPAYKAYLGEMYKLPVFGDFSEKQAGK